VAQQGRVPRPAHDGHLGPRGFGEVQGKLELDFERWTDATFEGQIDVGRPDKRNLSRIGFEATARINRLTSASHGRTSSEMAELSSRMRSS
jgi:hypothetical protein